MLWKSAAHRPSEWCRQKMRAKTPRYPEGNDTIVRPHAAACGCTRQNAAARAGHGNCRGEERGASVLDGQQCCFTYPIKRHTAMSLVAVYRNLQNW